MVKLIRSIFSKRKLFIALIAILFSSAAVAVLMDYKYANVAIDAITRATDSGYSYFSEDVSVLTDQRIPENDTAAVKLNVANNGMIIFDLDRVYALDHAKLYVGDDAGGYYIWAWLGGHRVNDGGMREPFGELVARVENYEFTKNTCVVFPFPADTYSDNVELNITSGADIYEFELYAKNKRIYTPQPDCLPLDFTGSALNTQMSIDIDIPDSLVNVELAALEISAYDIDDTSEVELYINDSGPLRPAIIDLCPDTSIGFVMSLDTQTLRMRKNKLRFVYANDFDGGAGGFRIERAAITLTYEISTGIPLNDHAKITTRGFELSQNYPNPFNAETKIRYSIPNDIFVTLKIYDVQGRAVRRLTNRRQPAGHYVVQWNGRDDAGHDLPSGLYFCTIQAGRFSYTNKLILLK